MNTNLIVETRDNIRLSLAVDAENVDVVTRTVEKSTILELVKSIEYSKLFGIATIKNEKDVVKAIQKKFRFSVLKKVVLFFCSGLLGEFYRSVTYTRTYNNSIWGIASALKDSRKCTQEMLSIGLVFGAVSAFAITAFPNWVGILYPALTVCTGFPGPAIGLIFVAMSQKR